MPQGERACVIFIYMQIRAWAFPTLESPVFSKSLPLSFSFPSGLLSLVGGLDFLICWFCMVRMESKTDLLGNLGCRLMAAYLLSYIIDL